MSQAQLDTESLLAEKYGLKPNNHHYLYRIYDEQRGYGELHELAKQQFVAPEEEPATKIENHVGFFKNNISAEDAQAIIDLYEQRPEGTKYVREPLPFYDKIITPELDAAIKDYFKSDYAIVWHGWTALEGKDDPTRYFTNWHCDSGPSCHLKIITYLNSTSDHGSQTAFAGVETTERLKEVGYVFNKIRRRGKDITDLTEFYGVDFNPEPFSFETGDSVVFNPAMRMHAGLPPEEGKVRKNLTLCLVPSPIGWRDLIANNLYPHDGNIEFAIGTVETIYELIGKEINIADDSDVIESTFNTLITSPHSLKFHLNAIFSNKNLVELLFHKFTELNVNYEALTISEVVIQLKKIFNRELNWDKHFNLDSLRNFKDLLEFEENFTLSQNAYSPNAKPNPKAVFWPIPNHEKHPACKFDMLPFVKRYPIMTKNTPVGSAGSCFAFELADYLQSNGYNYVVSELADNPEEEAIVDGYSPGSGKAKFSANYGILFNSPSLRQLAEKAFGMREFKKHLVQLAPNYYTDPYRENVFFRSKKNYLRDYPKHIAAVKQSLMESEVFIFTAGLNECWQMHDGTVISRNPKSGFHHLIKHRVLTVQENIDNITTFFEIVKQHNPKFKLVLTLSPIPLLATGRAYDHHIIEANTHSKAVLRVALEEIVKQHDDIFYLPSYELVTECSESPWLEDHRHVTRDTVARVMEMFNEMFVKTEVQV